MTMTTTTYLILLTLILSACAPIAQAPPPPCHSGFVSIPVNTSAGDPISADLPGHIDITEVETHLNGETLTAIFHFKNLPDMLDVSRTGMPFSTLEYFYSVSISIDGGPIYQRNLSDYTIAAYHQPQNPKPASGPTELMLHPVLWRNHIDKDASTIHFEEVPNPVRLSVSSQDHTLTMMVDVPHISPNATVLFVAEDFLSGTDGNSCDPNPFLSPH